MSGVAVISGMLSYSMLFQVYRETANPQQQNVRIRTELTWGYDMEYNDIILVIVIVV